MHERGEVGVLLDVELEVLARLRLEAAVHVDVIDGVANVLEDALVAHEKFAVLEAIGRSEKGQAMIINS